MTGLPDAPVLVIDDEPDLREAAVAVFENEGYSAVGANNGRVAYDLLRTGQLRSRKAGNRRLIGLSQIEAFLAGDE